MNNLKVVILAGATSMIGKACAHLLANEKQKLILLGQDRSKLDNLAKKLNTSVETYAVDMTLESAITSSIKEIIGKYGRIDTLIYNVAIYPWKLIDSLSTEEWRSALDVNLTGAFLLTRACMEAMKKQCEGKLIFISSLAGETVGLPNMSAYAASKAGLNGFMRTAALELAPFNINVNSISPGRIYDPSSLTEEEVQNKIHSIPFKRFVEPLDIAYMVEFLISENAKNITGQNIIIDGGQSISGSHE